MDRVLIVDDDKQLCVLLIERLKAEAFALETVHDGVRGLERALSGDHALVILDLMLPGLGGIDLLRRLRAQSDIPVLILTARGEEIERVLGLEIGATRMAGPVITGDVRVDPASREAWLKRRQLDLTSVEFTLLEMLVRHAGRVVSREELTEKVLGRKIGPFDRVIDVHVSNLRKKLGTLDTRERIKAVRNAGYLFVNRSEKR